MALLWIDPQAALRGGCGHVCRDVERPLRKVTRAVHGGECGARCRAMALKWCGAPGASLTEKFGSESFISSDCGEHLDSAMPGQSVDARTQVAR